MSDASQLAKGQERPLREEERVLLTALLRDSAVAHPFANLDVVRVVDMQDGGMGSIHFVQQMPRQYGKTLAEAHFIDEDGVPVSIALNVDAQGDLLELDFWKVNFTPLLHYPSPLKATATPPPTASFRQSA